MWFLYIVGVIIALVINVAICTRFGNIAAQKGHSNSEYFWICFLLGIAGYIMVAALPDLTTTYAMKGLKGNPNSPSIVTQGNSWSCTCGRENANYVTTCPCGINKRDVVK